MSGITSRDHPVLIQILCGGVPVGEMWVRKVTEHLPALLGSWLGKRGSAAGSGQGRDRRTLSTGIVCVFDNTN